MYSIFTVEDYSDVPKSKAAAIVIELITEAVIVLAAVILVM